MARSTRNEPDETVPNICVSSAHRSEFLKKILTLPIRCQKTERMRPKPPNSPIISQFTNSTGMRRLSLSSTSRTAMDAPPTKPRKTADRKSIAKNPPMNPHKNKRNKTRTMARSGMPLELKVLIIAIHAETQ